MSASAGKARSQLRLGRAFLRFGVLMGSQYAESADGFETESNIPEPEPVAPATPAATASTAPAADDIEVSEPSAPHGRDQRGRFRGVAVDPKPEAEDDEPAAVEAKPETAEPKKAKPREDPNARISQAIARQREAERRAEAAERRAAELEAARQQPPAEAPKPVPDRERYMAMPNAPKEEDYERYSDYTADLSIFIADQRYAEKEQARQQTAAQRAAEQARIEVNTAFISRIEAAEPNFLESVSQDVLDIPTFDSLQPDEPVTAWHVIGEELRRSEHVVGLMRFFTQHPDELQRLATLPPRDLTRSLAILETRIGAAPAGPAQAPRVSSQAKPPIRPERGAPLVSDEGSDDESIEAYIARENRRQAARRAR